VPVHTRVLVRRGVAHLELLSDLLLLSVATLNHLRGRKSSEESLISTALKDKSSRFDKYIHLCSD
jgi:hypothetical protein